MSLKKVKIIEILKRISERSFAYRKVQVICKVLEILYTQNHLKNICNITLKCNYIKIKINLIKKIYN